MKDYGCLEKLQHVLAILRATHWNAWSSHWQAKGVAFFADHELFAKIYESIEDDIDKLAEKLVGFYGNQSVDAMPSMELTYGMLSMCASEKNPFKRALMLEEHLQMCLEQAYEELEDKEKMTLGMDDLLQSIGDQHESFMYFLKQRITD